MHYERDEIRLKTSAFEMFNENDHAGFVSSTTFVHSQAYLLRVRPASRPFRGGRL